MEISEDLMIFRTDYMYNKGSFFTPEAEIFAEMGIKKPRMRVENCVAVQVGEQTKYLITAVFEDLSDKDLGKPSKMDFNSTC